ncbi:AraC family transcriptional regulator [Eubacterium multiforme]|uniref:Stage 0 sporulation protein A homolog n=1 Tax=Eubacterium multiforme TaxID=83339 RepID=A0ABT9UW45_9FIRM|nr:helix-turn-helix domain-containing protein [Eubacterium multiforme]MDQ0150547.1 two-component system response regulator YesN [Eubacterium multiforme]
MYRLLLIDDDILEIEAFKKIIKPLEDKLNIVGIAECGEIALKLDKDLDPDIIIISNEIPGINSLEVCDIIKKRNNTKVIIMMVGYCNYSKSSNYEKLVKEINNFLLKPICRESVLDILNKEILSLETNINRLKEKEFLLLDKIISGDLIEAKKLLNDVNHIYTLKSNGILEFKEKVIYIIKKIISVYGKIKPEIFNYINEELFIKDIIALKSVDDIKIYIDKFWNKIFSDNNFTIHNKLIGEKKINDSINIALQYIDKHYKERITLEDTAKVCNFSIYYFSKLFKKDVGMKFIDYVNIYKIEKAKYMLENTDISIFNIALELGYDESSYFSKVFKKIVGITPSEYRNKKI